MEKILYGIGVGPGDPDLITLKAIKALEKVNVVITPKIDDNNTSIALEIANKFIGEKTKIVQLVFPMTNDSDKLSKSWIENAEKINYLINTHKKVAFLTLGDPTTYSTYMYVLPHLKDKEIKIETIPGVNSFCSIASRVNTSLCSGNETICIIPLIEEKELKNAIDTFDNIIVMKPSKKNKELADILKEKKLENNFVLVSKCHREGELISYDIGDLYKKVPYLSTVLIKRRGV
ncbi:precorrin-2 C(20)-methyltransferase [Proteinivorax tanatarense]|uniref:Precorrin-2 C(20)-methyltransferase n=1 Tax=Proteinivorax tanatarense TaxID=1260629 RepID=A0AAU7VJM3_9FIRM